MDVSSLRLSGIELKGVRVSLRSPSLVDAATLAELMHSDTELLERITSKGGGKVTAEEFLAHVESWCREKTAISLAIVLNCSDRAIGLLSVANIDESQHTGRIGYWLASAEWGKGCMTEAFALALRLAVRLGLTRVSANIERWNEASWRLWKRYGRIESAGPGERDTWVIDLSPGSPARRKLDEAQA